jgi:hypothetical protein
MGKKIIFLFPPFNAELNINMILEFHDNILEHKVYFESKLIFIEWLDEED